MTTPHPKPRLRGVTHLLAAGVALFAGVDLIHAVPSGIPHFAALIYSTSLFLLLSISALYHVPTWTPRKRAFLRHLDHSAIYLLIAGSSTPFCMLALEGPRQLIALTVMWTFAAGGILKSVFWPHAPRALSSALYVFMGILMLPFLPQMSMIITPADGQLLVTGGALYILGAVIYALKKPNPFPTLFGYHEIFHLLVIAAAALHYIAIRSLLL